MSSGLGMTGVGSSVRTDATVRLVDLAVRLRRRWRVVVVVTIVSLALFGALGARWPRGYQATAVVTINPITTSPFGSTPIGQQVNTTTERSVVLSSRVASLAADDLGGDETPGSVRASLQVTSPLESQVLEITAERGDAGAAARTANAVAAAYLDFRATGAQQIADRLIQNLQGRIDALVEQLSDDSNDSPSPADLATIQQIGELRDSQSQLADVAINPGRVITRAEPPSRQSGPSLPLFLAPGLVLGLMAGAAMAIWRDRRDRHVHSGARLDEMTAARVIHEDLSASTGELVRRVAAIVGLVERDDAALPLIGIFGVDARSSGVLTDLLAVYARSADVLVANVSAVGRRRAIDRGWPAPEAVVEWGSNFDAVLIDAGLPDMTATMAALSNRLHHVVIAVDARSDVVRLNDLVERMRESGVEPDAIAVLPDRWHRRWWRNRDVPPSAGDDEPELRPAAEYIEAPGRELGQEDEVLGDQPSATVAAPDRRQASRASSRSR